MVSAGERSQHAGGEGLGRVQRSDSDRRCGNLRDPAEKPSITKLHARSAQREAGKKRTRLPSHVRRCDALLTLIQRLKNEAPQTIGPVISSASKKSLSFRAPRFW